MTKKLLISSLFVLAILLSLTISPNGTLAQNYTVPEQNALNQNNTPILKQVKNSYEVGWWMLVIPAILIGIAYVAFRTADEVAGRNEFAYHDINLDKDDKKDKESDKKTSSKKILHELK